MRELPLEDVATRLGLEPDRHDKHKWRGECQIVSITGQKFYDHLALKGGYGAIDLVMHVQQRSFKEALNWLSNGASSQTPPTQRSQQYKVPPERQPFQPPAFDDSKWAGVREYLTTKRQLPATLVDKLHHQGIIYADAKQNAVFIRQDMEGKRTGASLRGTYKDSQFKGLATGPSRDGGWFAFTQGEGQLERIVLTSSPIDAISAAALAKQKTGTTLFLSTDGAGSIPTDFLRQQLASGKQILVAYDADAVGEALAQKVMQALPVATRVKPNCAKDWNEQLIMQQEAQATAFCVKQMFNHLLRDVRIRQPDGSSMFEATNWRFSQQGEQVIITDRQDNREILRVEGNRLVTFNPTSAERTKLEEFRQDIAQAMEEKQQQQNSQQDQQQNQQRGRGRSL